MEIHLRSTPKNVTVIEGFPGFGLVGSIVTEFLVNHLNTEKIGSVFIPKMSPIIAIHNKEIVEPVSIYYNEKYNLIIFHIVTVAKGIEWELADAITKVSEELNARQIVCIEGVNSNVVSDKPDVFYYSNKPDIIAKLEQLNIKPMSEGIIMGATSALMLKLKDELPMSCFFAETHSNLPDSKASAEIIKVLDKYLGLEVDYSPLLKAAQEMEDKLKEILSKASEVQKEQDMKTLSYVG